MGKLPNVTLGRATAQRDPKVTLGTPSAERQRRTFTLKDIAPPRTTSLTLQQAIEQGGTSVSLFINELTGTQRNISLTGRAVPFKGSIKFASKMRLDRGEYTGFPRINQTVLGASENDTEMNGAWHDRFLGTPSAFVSEQVPEGVTISDGEALLKNNTLLTARDLCDLFEDVVYRARPLRVIWLHLRRLGRLTLFEQNWLNPHDVEWKMTFEWIGRDEQVGLPSPAQTTLVGLAQAFKSSYADVHAATNFDNLEGLDTGFGDRVDAITGKIKRAVAEAESAVEQRVSAVSGQRDALLRATSVATYVRDQAQQLIDAMDGATYPAMLAIQQPNSLVPDNFRDRDTLTDIDVGRSGRLIENLTTAPPGQAVTAACQQRAAVRAARQMRHTAARQRFAAIRSLQQDSLGTVMLRQGQDLRDLSRDWYGSPEDWEQIRRFNGLSGVSPPAGTLVFIPNPGTRS